MSGSHIFQFRKNSMIRPLRFALLILVSLAAPLSAVPLRFLPWDDEVAARKLALGGGKAETALPEMHPHKRSKPLAITLGETPPLLIALDRKGADGKPLSVVIKVAQGMISPLVLILSDPKNPAGLRTFVVEDNPTTFPWGTSRFINATSKQLLIRQEKIVTPLPPGWTPVDTSPGGEARNVGVQVAARDDLKSILYSSVWEYDPQIRKLIFIIPGGDERTGAIEMKIIPESRAVATADAP